MKIKLTTIPFLERKGILHVIMKTFLFLCCTTVFSFSSDSIYSQNVKITIDSDTTVTVYEVFDIIRKQTPYTFVYQSDIFKNTPKVQLKKGVLKLNKLLKESVPSKDFVITTTENNYIVIRRNTDAELEVNTIKINGTVQDQDGNPLAGITIHVAGTTNGTVTDLYGKYTLTVPNSEAILVFSSIGFMTKEILVGQQTIIDVIMKEDINQLDEVTLNAGYYKTSKRQTTGSISKVETKAIEQQPVSNPIAALQGRMAGVEITQTSGVPGAEFNIKIRGQNSIRSDGNDPLYIINGVPYASSSLGYLQTSGSILPGKGTISPLNNINPSDIESIEVLKDADATAIYGSRGANGVVLITTKRGKAGKTKFSIDISSGFGTVANKIDLLNTSEYVAMRREAYANDGIDPLPFNAYDVNGTWDETRETDWQEKFFGKTAHLTNIQGSLSGGNEQTSFLLSGNLNSQTTVFPGDYKNSKISVLANLQHHTINDKLNIQFSVNYTSDENYLPSHNLVPLALQLAPNAPELYNPDGTLNWENSTWTNPLARLESKYTGNGSTLIANTTFNYRIFEGLNLISNLGYTQSHLRDLRTIPSTIYNPAFGISSDTHSTAVHNNSDRKSWIAEPQLQWTYNFNTTKIETLIGFTFQEQNSNQFAPYAYGFTNNNLIESISAASGIFISNDSKTQYRYNAFFGRVNLNHKGKYILNLTGRRDGSSRFGSNKKFSNFAAIGGAWIFSKESFIGDAIPSLSFGKLRGSYGTSGNDQIGDYQYLDTYSFGSLQYQNVVGLSPTRLYNPNFSWEKNEKLEVALELGFLKDRIFVSSSYYRNKSSNQLVGIPLPGTTGFSFLNANLNATVENTGWEFELNTTNIENEHFKWSTSLNLTIPKNKLLEFPDLEGSTYKNRLVVGESLNIIKTYKSTGVNPQTGIYEFIDFNNDGIISSPDDMQVIKDLNPTFYGGIHNSLSYRNLQLDFLFQFTKQLGRNYLSEGGLFGAASNKSREVLHRWQNSGDLSHVQQFTSGSNSEARIAYSRYTQSDAAFSDASYLRLKIVSLSYQLPTKKADGFDGTLFLRGQNLLTFTNYDGLDPETRNNRTLPPLRFITIGTQITF